MPPFRKTAAAAAAAGALALTAAACGSSTTGGEGAGTITDGYEQVYSEQRGEYLVTLWQLPQNVVVGSVQFGVELRRAGTDPMEAVDNGQVQVYAHYPGHESQKSPAINTPRNPHFYESMLTLEEPGAWQVELRWEEPFEGSIFYEGLTVNERARTSSDTSAGQFLFIFIMLALTGIPALVWWRSRKRRQQRGGADEIDRTLGN